jgi:adenylate cyclase
MSGKRERLSDHWQCFDGIIPSLMATAARDGTPNIAYISHIYYIDEGHVALSNQFMSKTVMNIMENPRLQAMVVNAATGQQVILDLMFERSEIEGHLFELLAAQVSAVAEHHGMGHIMRLRSADIYRVLNFHAQEMEAAHPASESSKGAALLAEAVRVAIDLSRIEDLDTAIQHAVDSLQQVFGFGHSMVLLVDAEKQSLTTIASRGYNRQGVGAEIPWGKGVVGIAAEKSRNMRFAAVSRHLLYMENVAASGQISRDTTRIIPMPGLEKPQSLLAVPMIAGGEVRGVIFAESEERLAFAPYHEQAVALIAAQLAGLVAYVESSRELDAILTTSRQSQEPHSSVGKQVLVQRYAYDDSLFIDNDYVIKGVPGRILWRMLQIHQAEGRTEFTNREFRLDASLKLPEFKDNLETRLLLLSRRMAEKEFPIRIQREGRGRVTLQVEGVMLLKLESPN